MPEFEQRKRRSLTDQQLYEEYRNVGKNSSISSAKKKKSKGKSASAAAKKTAPAEKGGGNKASVKENVGERKKICAGAAAGTAGSGKSCSSGKASAADMERKRENTERAVAAAKKSKTFAGKKSAVLKAQTKQGSAKSGSRKSAGDKKKSRRRQGKYTLYYIFIGVVVIISLSILSATVLFNISVFVVNGDTRYSDEEIINACGIGKGENLLRINTVRGAERIVSSLVYIDSAEIHRGFPNRLSIIVRPAVPIAAYTYGGKYYMTSEGNRLLEIVDTPGEYPIVKGFSFDSKNMPKEGDYFSEDEDKRLSVVGSITSYMRKYGLDKSYVIDVSDTIEIRITYDDRIEITLGTSTALENKINNAGHVIHNEIADNERCTLYFTDQNTAVKRPIHQNGDIGSDGYVVPDETTAPEASGNPVEEPESA